MTPLATVSAKISREKSAPLLTTLLVRDIRSSSRPLPPSSESWLTAGTWFNSWPKSARCFSSVSALARVTQLICRSSSETDWPTRRAVASAFSAIASVSVALVAV